MIIHKRRFKDEDDKRIVPDGGSVRVSIMAMDSVQKQVAANDERVQHNIEANQATLAAMQRDAGRAQAFADHYTAQRKAEADNSAYGGLCARLEGAYMEAAA
jgi:hypothetical protein